MKKLILIVWILIAFVPSLNAKELPSVKAWNFIAKKEQSYTWSKGAEYRVIYFLSAICPCSQSHFDHLNQLVAKYPQFEFVGFQVDLATSEANVQKYFDQFQISFPIFKDLNLSMANALEAVKTPHIFVLDKQGNVAFEGAATNSRELKNASKFYLQDALASLAAGELPKVKTVKTLGCYIPR